MSLARPASQWLQIFREQTDGSPENIGRRIIGDIWGYRNSRTSQRDRYIKDDAEQIGNALLAYLDFAGPENQPYALSAMRRCTDLMIKLCEVVPPELTTPIHQPTCASNRPKYDDNRPYQEMGNCDCRPIEVDLTDEDKARIFDRVRDILYTKTTE